MKIEGSVAWSFGLVLFLLLFMVAPVSSDKKTYSSQGAYTHDVSGLDKVYVELWGAQGGKGGGKGSYGAGNIPVSGVDTLYVYVGGEGGSPSGGFNGGGNGNSASYNGVSATSGGGGGASDVRIDSDGDGEANEWDERVIVGAGGGGDAAASSDNWGDCFWCLHGSNSGSGGDSGASSGSSGGTATQSAYWGDYVYKGEGGGGGFQSSGGSGGKSCYSSDDGDTWSCYSSGGDGSSGTGGGGDSASAAGATSGAAAAGGGGGGGYYGGGGGGAETGSRRAAAGGGGGGSSYLDSSLSDTEWSSAVNSGKGTVVIYTPPPAPTSVSADKTGEKEITVDWEYSPDPNGFNIYRSGTSGVTTSDTLAGEVAGTKRSFTDSGLPDGEDYYYVVTAENKAGESDISDSEGYANLNDAPHQPTDPRPRNISFVEEGDVTISAVYSDPDNAGSLAFYMANGTEIQSSCTVLSDGERCSTTFREGLKNHGENWWYAVAKDEKGLTTEGSSWVFINNSAPYRLEKQDNPVGPADKSTVYQETVDLSVRTADPDGDRMNVRFYRNSSSGPKLLATKTNILNESTVSYSFDTSQGETYKWWVEQSDGSGEATGLWNTTKSQEWTFHRNDNPVITDVTPSDGSAVEEEDVELRVEAVDLEDTDLTARFYKSDNELLGTDDFKSGDTADYTWENRELGNKYEWRVEVSDGNADTATEFLSFRKLSTISYRTQQTIDYKYSSVVTASSSTRDLFLTIENRVSDEKKLRTYLSEMNATFLDGKTVKQYNLSGNSSKRIQVRLKPQGAGDKQLVVTTENTEIGINTTSTIPVQVREYSSASGASEVPGIGPIQVITLLLVSTYLYSVQL